jgi:hypothetical protein
MNPVPVFLAAALGLGLGWQAPSTGPSPPDFTGRWVLERLPDPSPSDRQLARSAANELTIRQNAASFTVLHSSEGARYPQAVAHAFGSSGSISRAGDQSETDVFWFGRELIVTESSGVMAADGVRPAAYFREKWSLEASGRIEIRIVDDRPGSATQTGRLVYRKR